MSFFNKGLGVSKKNAEFHERNSSKSSNFQTFVGHSRFTAIPNSFFNLSQQLTTSQFAGLIHLYKYCYMNNKPTFEHTAPELAEITRLSVRAVKTLVKVLNDNMVLFCNREKANGKNDYRWNVELWITQKSEVQNLHDGGAKFARPKGKNCTTEVQNLHDVYIRKILEEYIYIILLNSVFSAWRKLVDKPEYRQVENKLAFIGDKVADWESAFRSIDFGKVDEYLVILFFKHTNLDFEKIQNPTFYLRSCFNNPETKHLLQKQENYLVQSTEDFFSLYGDEVKEQINATHSESH